MTSTASVSASLSSCPTSARPSLPEPVARPGSAG